LGQKQEKKLSVPGSEPYYLLSLEEKGGVLFRNAKDLALDSMLEKITPDEYPALNEDLVTKLVELGWEHQHDQEPRRKVREEIKDLTSREANILIKEGNLEAP
jgi:hypothetical protein